MSDYVGGANVARINETTTIERVDLEVFHIWQDDENGRRELIVCSRQDFERITALLAQMDQEKAA